MRVIFVVVLGCSVLFARASVAQTSDVPSPCESKLKIHSIQNHDEGWKIDFVGALRSGPRLVQLKTAAGIVDVEVSEHAPKREYFQWIDVVVDTCNHTAELKTKYLRITHVYVYAVMNKVFAYGVYGVCGQMEKSQWIEAGCETGLMLVDTTGTGKFDSLQFGGWIPNYVPDWVHKAEN